MPEFWTILRLQMVSPILLAFKELQLRKKHYTRWKFFPLLHRWTGIRLHTRNWFYSRNKWKESPLAWCWVLLGCQRFHNVLVSMTSQMCQDAMCQLTDTLHWRMCHWVTWWNYDQYCMCIPPASIFSIMIRLQKN